MIVCVCHRVSDRDIVRAAACGCRDFESLQEELRVGTACGACLGCARETFEAQGSGSALSPRPAPRRLEAAHG